MNILEKIKLYANENSNKKIAMFVDMDGTIASLDIDIHNDISNNTKGYFLNKRPLQTVIRILEEISKISNIDLYILSACGYKEQALDKITWLERHAPFFKKENQIFVVKEIVNYTNQTKNQIKISNIIHTIDTKGYDLAIYFEDEYQMLRTAYHHLKDRILCIHISTVIE